MKRLFISILTIGAFTVTFAQNDSTIFKGHIDNDEYGVYINMDFYKNNITIPGQDILGEMPGYFGDNKDGRKWMIVDAEIDKTGRKAQLSMINDYGSEDLTATLSLNNDNSYTLEQVDGSTLKIARNRKWVKMPKKLLFRKK